MSYSLLLGGYRNTIAHTSFDASSAKIKVISETECPKNASWIEPASDGKTFYTLSEDEKKGAAYSVHLEGEKVVIGNQRDTPAGPAHIHVMKDGSGIVVATYLGQTVTFFPTDSDGNLSKGSESPNLQLEFAYEGKTAPNTERQDTSHPHQVIEGENGTLYVPDLGSDRVYIVKREGESGLKVHGYLQAPEGSGPRHLIFSQDRKHLYCLTEMGHSVIAWSLDSSSPSQHPVPDFNVSIVPDSVPSSHSKYMDSAELCAHPKYPNTLFASNRLELQIFDKQPDLPKLSNYPPSGDAVAIVQLDQSGTKVKEIKHVRTGCNNVRGMNVSPDGKFVALAGQDGGGVEIWAIEGAAGEEWKLAAKEESIKNVTTLVWV